MKPIHIDFADQRGVWRFDPSRPASRLAMLCASIALLMAALALVRGQAARAAEVQAQARLAQLQAAHQDSARAAAGRERLLAADQAMLRQGELHRALPWEAVFQAFEQAPAATLDSFEPDLARGMVKVHARLASIGALQVYIDGLQRSAVFQRVSLLRHETPPEGAGISVHYEAMLAAPYRLAPTEPGISP